MDWCADATVKETLSHRSQCGGFVVSQNSSAQSSHAHTRCRLLLFILLTINDRCKGRISATCSLIRAMKPNVDAAIASRSVSHGLQATDDRIRRRRPSEAQPYIHTLTLFQFGSLGDLMLRRFQVGHMGALVRNIMA